jgi:ribosomal protein L11 methyltransferase
MLQAVQDLPLLGRPVLDLGCGSGVLAISAVRLGAPRARGLDIDPDALANARENADLNGVTGLVQFDQCDFREASEPAQIVLANLSGALLERWASKLAGLVEPEGRLVAGGFMEVERHSVLAALQTFLRPVTTQCEEGWWCAVFERQPCVRRQRSRQI